MEDLRGCAVSGASARSLELYEQAVASLWLQRGDPLALARQAIAEAPAFVAARACSRRVSWSPAATCAISRPPAGYSWGCAAST